jgi:small basic protein
VHLSASVLQAVGAENAALLKDMHLFDPHFLRFAWCVITSSGARGSAAAAALAVHVGMRLGVEVQLYYYCSTTMVIVTVRLLYCTARYRAAVIEPMFATALNALELPLLL